MPPTGGTGPPVRPIDHFFGFHTFYPDLASGQGAAPFKTVLDYDNNLKRHREYIVLLDGAIGEESGSLDHMLGKAADFYEAEVDDMVAGLSSLMEPIIIVFLGTLIGGIVVSMYLPIFKLGQVV